MSSDEGVLFIEDPLLRAGFVKLPKLILRATNLSRDAKLLYALLLDYAWQEERCFPGHARLAADLQATDRSVRTWMKELITGGYISQRRRGRGQTNVYTLLRIRPEKSSALKPTPDPRPEKSSGLELPVFSAPEPAIFSGNKDAVEQDSTEQDTAFEGFEDIDEPLDLSDWYPTLDKVIRDTSRSLKDLPHWKSNQTRARRLVYDRSVDDDVAADLARETAAECSARKVGMAYFYRMLEQRLEEHLAAHPKQSLAGRYAHLVRR